jgi:hypothetical protein
MQVVAEDASVEDRFHVADVLGRQLGGLVKLDLAVGLANTPPRTTSR